MNEVRFQSPDAQRDQAFFVIDAPDWINVIPVDSDGNVLFVRQFRFGVDGFTLEIPGGMCDPNEDPAVTARRELREETGCEAQEWVDLGWVHPNPAIQSNRCYTYLARDVERVGDPQPDRNEAFEQIQVPLAEVPSRIADGQITHSLVLSAFQLLAVAERNVSD